MAGMRRQPQGRVQIDLNNPITRGLVFAYAAGATGMAGFGLNGVNQGPYQNSGGTVIAAPIATPVGLAARALLSNQPVFSQGVVPALQSQSYSLFALATGPSTGMQSAIDDDDGTTRRYQFRLNAGKVEFIPFHSGGAQTVAAATTLTAADLAHGFTMGATAGPGRYAAFQNGQLTAATPGGSLTTPTSTPAIGMRKSGVQAWMTGGLALTAAWSRTLSDDEMRSLAANPWQIFLDAPDDDDNFATQASAPSGITGNLNASLGAVGLSGAGATGISGAASIALGALSAASNGAVADSAVLASTLDAATLSAAGAVSAAGTLSVTLAPLAMSAAGISATGGTFAKTLGLVTLAASGSAPAGGALSKSLAPMALAGVGFVDSGSGQNGGGVLAGQLTASLQAATLVASGTVKAQGSADITLGALSVLAYGGLPVTGALQAVLGELTLVATAGMFVFTRSQARTYVIQAENRRYRIEPENRTYKIEP